jgi:hypothetical protein
MTPGYAPSAKKRHQMRKIAAPVGLPDRNTGGSGDLLSR